MLPTALEPNKNNEEKGLDGKILNLLGQSLTEKRKMAPQVHPVLADRWGEVSNSGLPTEVKTELMKKYPVPESCVFLDPPVLNK